MSHRIADWDPEDTIGWEAGNKNIARRNLIWSVAAWHEHDPLRGGSGLQGNNDVALLTPGDMSRQWRSNHLET